MRIEQLEFVLEVAKSGSMQKAAEKLHTSSQNVSKLIKQLEDELHIQIFFRNKYGVFLTPDGEKVYAESQKIMDSVKNLQNINCHSSSGAPCACEEIEHINILASHSSREFAAAVLDAIYDKYSVDVASIINKDSEEINRLLKNDSISVFDDYDYIITNLNNYELTYFEKNMPQFNAYLLHKFRLAVHISKKHPLADQKIISIKEIIQYPLIMGSYDFDYSSHVQNLLGDSGIALKPKFIFNSALSSQHYVQKNLGYGLLPYNEDADSPGENSDTVIIPLKERIFFYQILLLNPAVIEQPYTKLALKIAKKAFKDIQPLF